MVTSPKPASDSAGNFCIISLESWFCSLNVEDPAVERQVDQHETAARQDRTFQNKSKPNASYGLAMHSVRPFILFEGH